MSVRALFNRALWLVALLGAVGCKPAEPPQAATQGKLVENSVLEQWIWPDAKGAVQAGATQPVLIAHSAGVPGDRLGGYFELESTECVALLARGSKLIDDLDVFAYGTDGAVYGSDEANTKDATAIICPPHPGVLYVSARIAAGHGLVTLAAQTFTPDHAKAIATALSAERQLRKVQKLDSGWPGFDEIIAQHHANLGGEWHPARKLALPVDAKERTHFSLDVPAKNCTDVLVIPSEEVNNVDLEVVDLDGRVVGRAPPWDGLRSVVLCSQDQKTVSVRMRPHAGQGLVAVALSHLQSKTLPSLRAGRLRIDLTPLGSLAEVIANKEKALGSSQGVAKKLASGTLVMHQRESIPWKLPSGCHVLAIVPGVPAHGVRAWVYDDAGNLLGDARGTNGADIFLCGAARPVRIDIQPLVRGGPYALLLAPRPNLPALQQADPLAVSRLLALAEFEGVLERLPESAAPNRVEISSDQVTRVRVPVAVDSCASIVVAVGKGVEGVELRLLSFDEEVERREGRWATAARVCASASKRHLNLIAEIRAHAGRGTALVLTRNEENTQTDRGPSH